MESDSDDELINRAARGDRATWGPLYQRLLPRVELALVRAVRDSDQRREMAHAAIVEWLSRWLTPGHDARSVLTFIVSGVVRLSRSNWRNDTRRAELLDAYGSLADDATSPIDPETALQMREVARVVQADLARLSPREREVVIRFYYEDESVEAVASALGITKGNVGTVLHGARKKLRTFATERAKLGGEQEAPSAMVVLDLLRPERQFAPTPVPIPWKVLVGVLGTATVAGGLAIAIRHAAPGSSVASTRAPTPTTLPQSTDERLDGARLAAPAAADAAPLSPGHAAAALLPRRFRLDQFASAAEVEQAWQRFATETVYFDSVALRTPIPPAEEHRRAPLSSPPGAYRAIPFHGEVRDGIVVLRSGDLPRCELARSGRDVLMDCDPDAPVGAAGEPEWIWAGWLQGTCMLFDGWRHTADNVLEGAAATTLSVAEATDCPRTNWWRGLDAAEVATRVCRAQPALGFCRRGPFARGRIEVHGSEARAWIVDGEPAWAGSLEVFNTCPDPATPQARIAGPCAEMPCVGTLTGRLTGGCDLVVYPGLPRSTHRVFFEMEWFWPGVASVQSHGRDIDCCRYE